MHLTSVTFSSLSPLNLIRFTFNITSSPFSAFCVIKPKSWNSIVPELYLKLFNCLKEIIICDLLIASSIVISVLFIGPGFSVGIVVVSSLEAFSDSYISVEVDACSVVEALEVSSLESVDSFSMVEALEVSSLESFDASAISSLDLVDSFDVSDISMLSDIP